MLINVFSVATRDKKLSWAVRAALLETLFQSKLALFIGAMSGAAMVGVVIKSDPSPWLIICGFLLVLSGMARVVSFGMFKPVLPSRTNGRSSIMLARGRMPASWGSSHF